MQYVKDGRKHVQYVFFKPGSAPFQVSTHYHAQKSTVFLGIAQVPHFIPYRIPVGETDVGLICFPDEIE